MCGIVGMAGDIMQADRAAFHDMLMVCQVRGRDSTGAFRVGLDNEAHIAKAIGTPDILLNLRKYDKEINSFGKAFVGHCRSKTYGAANYENAHPFEQGDLTGVHNGTLRNLHKFPTSRQFGTDSEWLYWWASEEGMENVLPEVDFCGALVWWDAGDQTLNFYRNAERNLWVTYSADLKIMLWASEIWMFGAYSRSQRLWDGGPERHVYIPVEEKKIFSYKIANHGKTAKDIFTLTIKEIEQKEDRGHAGNWKGSWTGRGSNGGATTSKPEGGEVTSPFVGAQGWQQLLDEELNDPIPILGNKKGQVLLPSSPVLTSPPAGSTTTVGSDEKLLKSLRKSKDFKTPSIPSNNGKKPILSLVSQNSKNSQQESNVVTLIDSPSCSVDSMFKNQVTFRIVAGVPYISCKTTGREWTEEVFEEKTLGICCFCKQGIGDLHEVAQIFTVKTDHNEDVSFICTSCVCPKYSISR